MLALRLRRGAGVVLVEEAVDEEVLVARARRVKRSDMLFT